MQVTGGTITITTANPDTVTVTGEYDWSQVLDTHLFITGGLTFQIVSVGASSIVISPEYPIGAENLVTTNYVIVMDFTTNHQLPTLNPGDMEAATLFTRAMGLIDSKLGGGGGGGTPIDTDITITQAHSFVIGNALRYDYNGGNPPHWYLAVADSQTNARVVGIVIKGTETSSTEFTMRTQGKVTGIVGFSATGGDVAYLRGIATSPNLVTSTAGLDIKVPLMMMESNTAGYILTLAVNEAGLFGENTNGLVPGPTSIAGKFLKDDGTWSATAVADGSIELQHMKQGNPATEIDWTGFTSGTSGLALPAHMLNLNTRLTSIEASTGGQGNYGRAIFSRRLGGGAKNQNWYENGGGSIDSQVMSEAWRCEWTVPAGVTRAHVTVIRGAFPVGYSDWSYHVPTRWSASDPDWAASYVIKAALPVVPGQKIEMFFGMAFAGLSSNWTTHLKNGRTNVRVYNYGTLVVEMWPQYIDATVLDSEQQFSSRHHALKLWGYNGVTDIRTKPDTIRTWSDYREFYYWVDNNTSVGTWSGAVVIEYGPGIDMNL